jgi:hypothetical protein
MTQYFLLEAGRGDIGKVAGWGTWIQSPNQSDLSIFNDLAEPAFAMWGPSVGYVNILYGRHVDARSTAA